MEAGRSRGRKKGLQKIFDEEKTAAIAALIDANTRVATDFETLETLAKQEALKIAAQEIERRLNEESSADAEPHRACSCGQEARYAGRLKKTFECAVGPVTLERAYYHCSTCHRGFCPQDRAWGIEHQSLSPGVLRMVGLVAARVSFAESEELLQELAGVRVEAKHVERAAEALGDEVAQDEHEVVEEPSAETTLPPTLYLGMDGTGVPMRHKEVEGRAGKAEDGIAKTREAKLCTVWSAESRNEKGAAMRDPGSVTYSAAIESAATNDTDHDLSDFAKRVEREARRRGFSRAPRCVVLGDAAPWIWNTVGELFPGAIEIVDIYHAEEHLNDVARAIWGAGSDLGSHWTKKRKDELYAGEIDAIIQALKIHSPEIDEARQCIGYLENNRSRLRYPEFLAQGLCISTGVLEAGCRVAIGCRLKQSGMHWTLRGANAIMALRTTILSGRFQDFWNRRKLARVA